MVRVVSFSFMMMAGVFLMAWHSAQAVETAPAPPVEEPWVVTKADIQKINIASFADNKIIITLITHDAKYYRLAPLTQDQAEYCLNAIREGLALKLKPSTEKNKNFLLAENWTVQK